MKTFDWGLFPEAESFLRSLVDDALKRSRAARRLAGEIEKSTSTAFFDWIDHAGLPEAKLDAAKLRALHFSETVRDGVRQFRVSGSTLFPIVAAEKDELVLGPESLSNFCMANFPDVRLGKGSHAYQKARLDEENGLVLAAVERRGYDGYGNPAASDARAYEETLNAFRARLRTFATPREGFAHINTLIAESTRKLPNARITDAFFRAEREHWQSHNRAAGVQKARQDALGLGWGNIDHLTFRSSRSCFALLVGLFERLGLVRRERYYAGAQAGWGAQILEHPDTGDVVFADVDLAENERGVDFSRQSLAELGRLGTVGLWAAIHGESIFQAGPHHAAARLRFEDATSALGHRRVTMMKPFSNFPFLKQVFTTAEVWTPRREKLEALASKGLIDRDQMKRFSAGGVIGSHLENIERRQGFKGFNQDSVSAIIKATDPRLAAGGGA
jgi:hypothetical protein